MPGEVFVLNLGPLQWNDNDNGNGVHDIGEIDLGLRKIVFYSARDHLPCSL